jgi:hypothetical protein
MESDPIAPPTTNMRPAAGTLLDFPADRDKSPGPTGVA